MIVTIHQPEHLPWLGLFDKVRNADLFVVLDTVQFRKNYFQNRNRIRTRDGWCWLTLPVLRPLMVPIREVRIDAGSPVHRRHTALLEQHYGPAPHFGSVFPAVAAVVDSGETSLARVNVELLAFAFDRLAIGTPTVLASSLDLPPADGGSEVCRSICRAVGATTYLSGPSGPDYLAIDRFAASGIEVVVHEFHHPVYEQLHDGFVPRMSVVDLLFNHGARSAGVLRGDAGDAADAARDLSRSGGTPPP